MLCLLSFLLSFSFCFVSFFFFFLLHRPVHFPTFLQILANPHSAICAHTSQPDLFLYLYLYLCVIHIHLLVVFPFPLDPKKEKNRNSYFHPNLFGHCILTRTSTHLPTHPLTHSLTPCALDPPFCCFDLILAWFSFGFPSFQFPSLTFSLPPSLFLSLSHLLSTPFPFFSPQPLCLPQRSFQQDGRHIETAVANLIFDILACSKRR